MSKSVMTFIFIFAIVSMLAFIGLFFYLGGIRKYGTPSEFRAKQLELIQASMDSIKAAESSMLLPENIADSTLFGVGRHTEIFEDTERYQNQLKKIQASLDSIDKEKKLIEERERSVDEKFSSMMLYGEQTEKANLQKLASIYDAMKPPQAVPLIIKMDDTLAVKIISLMDQRMASKLLGAVAEADVEKATRLNKLLAEMGTTKQP